MGLGNPGPSYAKTRHNIGRRLIEFLAEKSAVSPKSEKSLKSHLVEIKKGPVPFCVAYPDLYMNQSGDAVLALVEHFYLDSKSDLLVVSDEAALPFGRLRLRGSGTDGGHKGLRSVEEKLGTQTYARLRIGIGPTDAEKETEETLEEYVLNPFSAQEERALQGILEHAAEGCFRWMSEPLEKAMNWINAPQS